jgi:hypothetical protein
LVQRKWTERAPEEERETSPRKRLRKGSKEEEEGGAMLEMRNMPKNERIKAD